MAIHKNTIVITRPLEDQKSFSEAIKTRGIGVFSYPTITIHERTLTKEEKEIIQRVAEFDWIVFTSKNGIRYFLTGLKKADIDPRLLQNKKIAVIGPATEREAQKQNLHVAFIPSAYTTENLGEELPEVKGKKILLPRAAIASQTLPRILQKRGASAIELPIYQTTFPQKPTKQFENYVSGNNIFCIIFTSPSTIEGFMIDLSPNIKKTVLQIPVLVIGPVTKAAAENFGFTTIHMAKSYTSQGVINLLKEMM